MNFVLESMSALCYFIPLVIEGNSRNIKSRFFILKDSRKYNSPHWKENSEFLINLSKMFNIDLFPANELKKFEDLTFLIEGVGCEGIGTNEKILNDRHVKVSLTRLTDYTIHYWKYVDKVDHIIFPNKFLAEYYDEPWVYPIGNHKAGNTLTEKNLYLGCPKYDDMMSKKGILRKMPFLNPDDKYCLVMSPQGDLFTKTEKFSKLLKTINSMGYKTLIKARGKDPAPPYFQGDHYFQDWCWFPHDTMLLLTISDFYINFGSTVVKEATMIGKPSINFELKKFRHLDFLFDQDFNICLNDVGNTDKIKESIKILTTSDFENDYYIAREKYLHHQQNSSRKILDYFYNKQ